MKNTKIVEKPTNERSSSEIFKDLSAQLKPCGRLFSELFAKWCDIINCILLAFVVNFAVEMFCRQSIYECLVYIHNHPWSYLYNTLIVLFTLCPGLALRKRYFWYAIACTFWLGLGVSSAIILVFRQTPLTANDFLITRSVVGIFDKYLSGFQMVLVGITAAAIIALLAVILIKAPAPSGVKRKKSLAAIFVIIAAMTSTTYFANNYVYSDSDSFASLIRAFDDYGFAYSFSITTFDGGVDKPKKYSESYMESIKAELEEKYPDIPADKKPNIIYLQLESFFDVNHIIDYAYSENPLPNFEKLKEEYPSGYFTVPSIGGGTSNTEFEALTGLNMDYFGVGEYPYKTIMKKTTAESICYDLKNHGYATHAIHDYTGTFYSRNEVYKNLGFDSFTPIEYMYNLEYTANGWAKDKVLIGEIMKTLKSTEGQDFIHAVSVQGHGRYPNEKIDPTHTITVEGISDPSVKAGFEYYVNEIHDMDKFIKDLTDTLKDCGEDVVLVMWGDHLPTFTINNSQLENGDVMQTEYVVWSNFGLELEDKDIYSYQITPRILNALGIHDGWVNKLHNADADDPEFDTKYRCVEYDMLYGGRFLWGENRLQPTDMKMGIDEITIDSVYVGDEQIYVYGKNFNSFSKIVIDGDEYYTRQNGDELSAVDVTIHDGSEITVVQKKGTVLGSTKPFIYHETQPQTEYK